LIKGGEVGEVEALFFSDQTLLWQRLDSVSASSQLERREGRRWSCDRTMKEEWNGHEGGASDEC
jgi:hypothetical protein